MGSGGSEGPNPSKSPLQERPRQPLPPCPPPSSSSSIRRTSSLDTLTGSYLAGHWPREASHTPGSPWGRDKATQTPSVWAEECRASERRSGEDERRRGSHRRSASWGSTGQLKEIAKLRQQLQRSKHSSRCHRDKGQKSPFNGNHTAVHQLQVRAHQAPPPRSAPVSVPVSRSPASRFRSSVEGLNQEIETLIIREAAADRDPRRQDVPDGRRAPPPLLPYVTAASQSSRTVDTQTPASAPSAGLCPISPLPEVASSPKPNNSLLFQREPPEGCERVKVFSDETLSKRPQLQPPVLLGCPDRNKVNFVPNNSGSAFCLVIRSRLPPPTPSSTNREESVVAVKGL
ncbi:protein FAM117B-like [Aplochiton taeniatus]